MTDDKTNDYRTILYEEHIMAENQSTEKKRVEIKIPCEVYSRIVGYLRPVQAWNKGKQQEFQERRTFSVPEK